MVASICKADRDHTMTHSMIIVHQCNWEHCNRLLTSLEALKDIPLRMEIDPYNHVM